jgi:hypothetical protein
MSPVCVSRRWCRRWCVSCVLCRKCGWLSGQTYRLLAFGSSPVAGCHQLQQFNQGGVMWSNYHIGMVSPAAELFKKNR